MMLAATQCKQDRLTKGVYIVLSQDCDILNHRLDKEPVIELINADHIGKVNQELATGKNPRQLHLKDEQDHAYELIPHNRVFIDREYLQELKAAPTKINARELKILIRWITKRYRRPAFPDAFNHRVDAKTMKKIKRVLNNQAKESKGLFIRLNTKSELPDNENYKIYMVLIVPKEYYDNEEVCIKIRRGFDEILEFLDKIPGLEMLPNSHVESEDGITIHHYSELEQWDLDYISFLNGAEGEVINID